MKKFILLLFLLSPALLFAQHLEQRNVTIHQSGGATVYDQISYDLNKGENRFEYTTFLKDANPNSFYFYDTNNIPRETSYFSAKGFDSMLQTVIGSEIILINKTNQTYKGILKQYSSERYIIEQGDGSILFLNSSSINSVQLLNKPKFYEKKPSLELVIHSDKNKKSSGSISYQVSSFSWEPLYKLIFNEKMSELRLQSIARIRQTSSYDVENINLHLVFGNLRNDIQPMPLPKLMARSEAYSNADVESVSSKSLGDEYILSLPGKISLKSGEFRQIYLDDISKIKPEKWYEYYSSGSNYKDVRPAIMIRFKAEEKKGFHFPLASGTADIMILSDDELKNISNVRIPNTALEEQIELNLGKAMDVSLSETITKSEQINPKLSTASFKLEITNHRKETIRIKINRGLDSATTITESNTTFENDSVNSAVFWFTIASGKTATLTYSTRTEYR